MSPRLITADDALPEVERVPAPWTLHGSGWILLLELPGEVRCDPRHLPEELRGLPLGGPSLVMFVDYADSPAGPYRELLYIPGRFHFPDGRRAWSVTRIYVSSWDSVVNGRLNWGIPKDRADFDCASTGRGERIRVTVDDRQVASLELERRGLAWPVHSGLVPDAFRRVVQHHGDRRFELAPEARGRAGRARLESAASDGELFPDLGAGRVRTVLHVPRFRLRFPKAS